MQNKFTTINVEPKTSRRLNIISAVTGLSKSEIIDSLIESDPKYHNILQVTLK